MLTRPFLDLNKVLRDKELLFMTQDNGPDFYMDTPYPSHTAPDELVTEFCATQTKALLRSRIFGKVASISDVLVSHSNDIFKLTHTFSPY